MFDPILTLTIRYPFKIEYFFTKYRHCTGAETVFYPGAFFGGGTRP